MQNQEQKNPFFRNPSVRGDFVGPPPRSERGELACHAEGMAARRPFLQIYSKTASRKREPYLRKYFLLRITRRSPDSVLQPLNL